MFCSCSSMRDRQPPVSGGVRASVAVFPPRIVVVVVVDVDSTAAIRVRRTTPPRTRVHHTHVPHAHGAIAVDRCDQCAVWCHARRKYGAVVRVERPHASQPLAVATALALARALSPARRLPPPSASDAIVRFSAAVCLVTLAATACATAVVVHQVFQLAPSVEADSDATLPFVAAVSLSMRPAQWSGRVARVRETAPTRPTLGTGARNTPLGTLVVHCGVNE